MAAFNNGNLRHFYLNPQRTLVTQTNIVQGINAAGDIETGPDGAFWYFQESPYSPQVNLMRLSGPGPTSTVPPSPTRTITPGPPTNTRTPGPPTNTFTPAPPTNTFTPAPPSNTPTETATSTPYQTPTPCPLQFSDVPVGST